MIQMGLTITYIRDARYTVRNFATAMSLGLAEAVQWWHERYLPRHFRQGAADRYGYERRSKRYMIRKARKKHHQRPLEWSGNMKRVLMRSLQISYGKSRPYAEGRLQRPHVYSVVNRRSSQMPDIPNEVKATTREEVDRLARVFKAASSRQLRQMPIRKRKVTIK
jgi:hypothetical protein